MSDWSLCILEDIFDEILSQFGWSNISQENHKTPDHTLFRLREAISCSYFSYKTEEKLFDVHIFKQVVQKDLLIAFAWFVSTAREEFEASIQAFEISCIIWDRKF